MVYLQVLFLNYSLVMLFLNYSVIQYRHGKSRSQEFRLSYWWGFANMDNSWSRIVDTLDKSVDGNGNHSLTVLSTGGSSGYCEQRRVSWCTRTREEERSHKPGNNTALVRSVISLSYQTLSNFIVFILSSSHREAAAISKTQYLWWAEGISTFIKVLLVEHLILIRIELMSFYTRETQPQLMGRDGFMKFTLKTF